MQKRTNVIILLWTKIMSISSRMGNLREVVCLSYTLLFRWWNNIPQYKRAWHYLRPWLWFSFQIFSSQHCSRGCDYLQIVRKKAELYAVGQNNIGDSFQVSTLLYSRDFESGGVNWSGCPRQLCIHIHLLVNKLRLGEAQLYCLSPKKTKLFQFPLQRVQVFWSKAISMYTFLVIHWGFMLKTPVDKNTMCSRYFYLHSTGC